MGSIQNTVYYCCVSRGSRILYSYNGGDQEIESLSALCLENTPLFHKWYFETIAKQTFGFLIEDGYVYFTIVDEGLGNLGVLQFLEHVRDEFKKAAMKGSRGSFSGINSISMQEQLVPVIRRLITSLEDVSHDNKNWMAESPLGHAGPSPSPSNANENSSSTKSPLLGNPNKHEKKKKKKTKDRGMAMRDIQLEEDHRKSTDRGVKIDMEIVDSTDQGGASSSSSLHKDSGSMRMRSNSQNIQSKWRRQVRIILAIDVAICMILLLIWLVICRGISCIR